MGRRRFSFLFRQQATAAVRDDTTTSVRRGVDIIREGALPSDDECGGGGERRHKGYVLR